MTEPGRAGEWEKAEDDVLIPWRKSRFSGEGQDCVEVQHRREAVDVRDTKDREGGSLTVSSAAWDVLLEKIGKE